MTAKVCQGCGEAASDFQCPLCQAEGLTDRGFFCTQECFAKHWLAHRNEFHKSGVVREKKGAAKASAITTDTDAAATGNEKHRSSKGAASDGGATQQSKKKKEKRSREEREKDEDAENDNVASSPLYLPWPPLPSATVCAAERWAQITPSLALDCPRAVIHTTPTRVTTAQNEHTKNEAHSKDEGNEETENGFWSAVVAAAQYIVRSLQERDSLQVLVCTGSPYSAHAMAWGLRCAGVTGALCLAVSVDRARREGVRENSFNPTRRVVIATDAVLRASTGAALDAASGAASLWLCSAEAESLVVTLPDVHDPEDLQGIRMRGIFFTYGEKGSSSTHRDHPTPSTTTHPSHAVPSPSKQKGSPAKQSKKGKQQQQQQESRGRDTSREDEPAHETVYTVTPLCCTDVAHDGMLRWQPPPMELNGALPVVESVTVNGADGEADVGEDAVEIPAYHRGTLSDVMNDDVSTCLANGDIRGALYNAIRVYDVNAALFEATLFNALCCDWGAVSAAHAHHRLAFALRCLCTYADRLSPRSSTKKGGSMVTVASNVITRITRFLPAITESEDEEEENEKKGDAHAEAKGVSRIVHSPSSSSSSSTKEKKNAEEVCTAVMVAQTPRPEERRKYANYYSTLPNLQLQATLFVLFDQLSVSVLDSLASAWGITQYVEGMAAFAAAGRARQQAVARVTSRYTPLTDSRYVSFLVVLMHLLYDAVAVYSLSEDVVQRRLLWNLTLARELGPLPTFLSNCFLLQEATSAAGDADSAKKPIGGAGVSLSSRQKGSPAAAAAAAISRTKLSRDDALRSEVVRAASPSDFIALPWKSFPLAGQREREVARLHRMAIDEVLMAMPRVPRPMFIGDVGNLLGKWFRFNARFGGVLGVSLSDFLSQHTDVFTVAGRLVTRRTAGKGDQVRMRFDDIDDTAHHRRGEADGSDSDDEASARQRKARDRELLTGVKRGSKASKKAKAAALEKELPARARKRLAQKAFNKERFNRNYKSIDPSARVPGYVKRGPRRIKGRGKKANKRVTKRG